MSIMKEDNSKKGIVDSYDVDKICQLYKRDFNLDVSRFFEESRQIMVYQNAKTKLKYFKPNELAGDDQFYQELESEYISYYSKNKWEFQKALDYINPNHRILEVGCGYGYFLDLLIEKGIEGEGIELNSKAVDVCREKSLNVSNRTIEELIVNPSERYDVICAFQVFEHIADVESVMIDICKLLNPNGLLIFGVPNNNSSIFKYDKYHTLNTPPHHMVLWDEESIYGVGRELLEMQEIEVFKEPGDKYFRANSLRLRLEQFLGSGLLRWVVYGILRPIVKVLPIRLDANTILGIYRK